MLKPERVYDGRWSRDRLGKIVIDRAPYAFLTKKDRAVEFGDPDTWPWRVMPEHLTLSEAARVIAQLDPNS